MSAWITIAFADPSGNLTGFISHGGPGMKDGELLCIGESRGEKGLFGPAGEEETSGVMLSPPKDKGTVELNGDSVRIDAPGGGWNPLTVEISVAPLEAAAESFQALRGGVTITFGGSDGARSAECAGVLTSGPQPPAGATPIRELVAICDDGSAFALRAAGEPGSDAHDQEQTEALLIGEDGSAEPVAEPLLSTQYDEEGRQTRAGLELWVGADDRAACRGAGLTRIPTYGLDVAGSSGWTTLMDFGLEGAAGRAVYSIWRSH